ncbi:hypothetical protein J4573_04860 [Actinomadura barringtoniae]|uniref:DUF6286 domain-containing protein n=1 Tax=Actinomadura barringtoniae TaxID=1427535 RepID=A0A939T2D4_9ACTN|nr:DUF6286 domain-containing protein [Actinomadura barringtoniae]MBO2446408.1 hypothetical protein [Actinomadura barringtoniae]
MTTAVGRLPQADRAARKGARRVFRPRRLWPALVAAILLTAVGAVVAIEVISTLAGHPTKLFPYEKITNWLTETSWNAVAAVAIAAGLIVLGLFFLLEGVVPGHTSLVRLRSDDPDLVLGVTRKGLRTAVADAAHSVDLVSDVRRVKVHGKRVTLAISSPVRSGDLKETVAAAVRSRLDELGALEGGTVTVRHKGA